MCGWSGVVRRKHRGGLDRFLAHPSERIRRYALEVASRRPDWPRREDEMELPGDDEGEDPFSGRGAPGDREGAMPIRLGKEVQDGDPYLA